MSEKTPLVVRPVLITIICSILFAAGLFSIVYTFTGAFAPYGVYYSALNAIITVLIFAALSGIWAMEKWGVYLFSLMVPIKFGVDFFSGAFGWWELSLILPIAIFISQFKKMN